MKNYYRRSYALALTFALFLTYSSPLLAQNPPLKTISGTITDADGPLSGVNVLVKNSARGSISGLEGRYSVTATASDTLVFTHVGYKTQEVAVGNIPIINVVMEVDAQALDAVVINAGYYKVSDREKTGSITRVTAAEIENQPVSNPLAAMQGRMAGVNIVQTTGVPGGGFSVRIRGRNSIRADGSEPLYIVDGVPYPSRSLGSNQISTVMGQAQSPLNGINPTDIESIEVLKDADATAIYGSRGANGVVLITTKKGKIGKTSLHINSSTGVGNITRTLDLLNTPQYLQMRREAFANDGFTEYPANAYDINGTWDPTRYTDWQEVLLGNTVYYNTIEASFTGGSSNNQFLLKGSHRKETTVFPGNFDYKKSAVLSSYTHTSIDQKLRVRFTGNYVSDNNQLPTTAFVHPALNLAPNAPALYDENGELNWENSTFSNPLAQLASNYRSQTSTLLGNGNIAYTIFKGLTLATNLGYNEIHLEETNTNPNTVYDPAYGLGPEYSSISVNTAKRSSWIVEPQLEYEFQLGKMGVALLAGTTFQSETNAGRTQYAEGFTSNNLIYDLSSATNHIILSNREDEYRYNAAYGRINLNLQSKYILNLTGRRDGSSRFGPGKRLANFGAVGAAWLFGNEDFIKNEMPFLSFGKIRGSFGSSGNDQIGNYGYLNTYIGTGTTYQGIPTLQPANLYNPDYGWETNRKLELALELGFLRDRINLSTAIYRNRSSSQLVGIPLPGTTGFPSIQANLDATVENRGLEIELNTVNLKNANLTWTTSAQLTIPRNKLVSFPNLEGSTYANRYVVGESLDIALLLNYTGIDPNTGLYTFQDYDGDGAISFPNDLKKTVRVGVDYYGSFGNTLSYKNLSFDFLLQFVKQTGYNFQYTSAPAGFMANQPTAVLDHWQQQGDQGFNQQFTAGFNEDAYVAYSYHTYSNAVVSDASFIRLKNVSLSYIIPDKAFGNRCRIYALAQNLFTITDFIGMDPETQSLGQLPPLRVMSLGVELSI